MLDSAAVTAVARYGVARQMRWFEIADVYSSSSLPTRLNTSAGMLGVQICPRWIDGSIAKP